MSTYNFCWRIKLTLQGCPSVIYQEQPSWTVLSWSTLCFSVFLSFPLGRYHTITSILHSTMWLADFSVCFSFVEGAQVLLPTYKGFITNHITLIWGFVIFVKSSIMASLLTHGGCIVIDLTQVKYSWNELELHQSHWIASWRC